MTAVGARVAWLFFGLCRASEFIACPALERANGTTRCFGDGGWGPPAGAWSARAWMSNASYAAPEAPLRWLHIPKCGRSFRATLLALLCHQPLASGHRPRDAIVREAACAPDARAERRAPWLPGKLSGHQPLRPGDEPRAVAMFRLPAQRLISAFHDARHAHGADAATSAVLRGDGAAAHNAGLRPEGAAARPLASPPPARGEALTPARFARTRGLGGCAARDAFKKVSREKIRA